MSDIAKQLENIMRRVETAQVALQSGADDALIITVFDLLGDIEALSAELSA